MSDKWNKRYHKATALPAINPLLQQWQHLLPSCQPPQANQPTFQQPIKQHLRALDLACGLGQNAFYLATKGFVVDAWDSSSVAIKKVQDYAQQHSLAVRSRQVDFVQDDLSELEKGTCGAFDFVIVNAYLQRELCPQIIDWLKPNGVLFYQTFNQIKVGNKPSNSDFLLQPSELLRLFSPLLPLVYLDEQQADEKQAVNSYHQNEHATQNHNFGKALLIAKKRRAYP